MVLELFAQGEVAEWLKAATCKGRYTVKSRIGGSNPSPLRHQPRGMEITRNIAVSGWEANV